MRPLLDPPRDHRRGRGEQAVDDQCEVADTADRDVVKLSPLAQWLSSIAAVRRVA